VEVVEEYMLLIILLSTWKEISMDMVILKAIGARMVVPLAYRRVF